MKKLLTGILLVSMALPSFADCTNAYEIKAKRRAQVNKVLTQTAAVAIGVGFIIPAAAGLVATGGSAIFAVPVLYVGTEVVVGAVDEIKETKENNFFEVLASIEGAKQGVIPYVLLDKLDKKMSYYSLSDQEQKEINEKIIEIILDKNESKELCLDSNGKVKPLNFKKFVRSIVSNLNLE